MSSGFFVKIHGIFFRKCKELEMFLICQDVGFFPGATEYVSREGFL